MRKALRTLSRRRSLLVVAVIAGVIAVPASAHPICDIGSVFGQGQMLTWGGAPAGQSFSIQGSSDGTVASGTLSFSSGGVSYTPDADHTISFGIANDDAGGPYDWLFQQGKVLRNGVPGWCYQVQAGDYYPNEPQWGPDTMFVSVWNNADCFGDVPFDATSYSGPVNNAAGGNISIDNSACTPTVTPHAICGDKSVKVKGKLASLTFQYNAQPCSASHNTQAAGKWTCTGVASNPIAGGAVQLVISSGTLGSGTIYNTATVTPGSWVTVMPSKGFSTQTYWVIKQGNTVLQSGTLHTSCSQPLVTGDQYGALLLTDGTLTAK